MRRSAVDDAKRLLQRRKFSHVVDILDGKEDTFKGNFDYHLTLGIACLYLGDHGSASYYFDRARSVRMKDVRLHLGQAAVFLRQGATERAILYYYEVLENEPANRTATAALDFIRDHGDYDTIQNWADSGRLQAFYPPLGVNPDRILGSVCAGVCVALLFSVLFIFIPRAARHRSEASRSSLAGLNAETPAPADKTAAEQDSSSVYSFSEAEVERLYRSALEHFDSHHDNAAHAELNRILRSNASDFYKEKARTVIPLLVAPKIDERIDTVDRFSVAQVERDLPAYEDCYVIWDGIISSVQASASQYSCNLLVGEHEKRTEGIVPLHFAAPPVPLLDEEKPVRVLGRIRMDSGRLALFVERVYQSPKGTLPVLAR